ncbi:hypothetical protein IV102_13875 [bacterium]|nr:hypothetical protein [bacterium]
MISCRQASLWIEDELHKALPWHRKARLWLHLLGCRMCQTYRLHVARIRSLFRREEWIEESPGLSPAARERIRENLQRELNR